MSDSLIETYTDLIDDEILALSDFLARGSCIDHEEYKHKTGMIKGLELAKTVIHDEFNKIIQTQETEQFDDLP